MALYIRCPNKKCRTLVAPSTKVCSCGHKLPPAGKTFYSVFRPRPSGKQIKKKLVATTLAAARFEEADLIREARDTEATDRKPTFREISDRYLAHLEAADRSDRYLKDTRRYLRAIEDFMQGVEPITNQQIENFRFFLRGRGVALATCDRHLAAGKAAWTWALPDDPNPFKQVKAYHPNNTIIRYLIPEQRERLLVAAQSISRHLFETIVTAMITGLRKRNVLELRRDQIDWTNGMLTVTQKGERSLTIPIPSSLLKMLSEIPSNDTPYFWVSSDTGQPYRVDWKTPWERAKRIAGIPKEFRWHDLRHDRATSLLANTGNLRLVQEVLGHSTSKITERYAHVFPEKLRSVMEENIPEGIVSFLSPKNDKTQ